MARSDFEPAPREPPIVRARPETVVDVAVRRRELEGISDRLARVAAPSRSRPWAGVASGLGSVGLGALIAGVPLLSSSDGQGSWVVPTYAAAVTVVLILGAVCWFASRSVQLERIDSVGAVKEDLDVLLDAYEMPYGHADGDELDLRAVEGIDTTAMARMLKSVRREARTNRQLIQQVVERGRYWRLTDNTPSVKAWKQDRFLVRDDDDYEPIFEAGEAARSEVDRVLQVRSLRMLRGGRVRTDDRLDDAVQALQRLEDLVSELDRDSAQ